MESMILPLKRYAQFSGRSRRKEFWLWFLFVILASIVLSVIDSMIGLGGRTSLAADSRLNPHGGLAYGIRTSGGILTGIFSLAILIPNLSVAVRRLHDTDRSGWWLLAPILPYVIGAVLLFVGLFTAGFGFDRPGASSAGGGAMMVVGGILMFVGFVAALILLVFYCLDGTRGPNRFGPDPKDPASTADLREVFR